MAPFFYGINKHMSDKKVTINYKSRPGVEFKLWSFLENQKRFNIMGYDDIRLEKYRLEFVPFHLLKITQKQLESFRPDHAQDILNNFHPALHRPSGVALYEGNYVLWDGHHSAVTAMCVGMQTCPCVVYKCDSIDEINDILKYDTIENFDTNQLLDMIECSDELREEILKRFK